MKARQPEGKPWALSHGVRASSAENVKLDALHRLAAQDPPAIHDDLSTHP